jgi:MYXO-CTERM domain-containing protein
MTMRAIAIAGVILLLTSTPIHAEGEGVNGFPNWAERVMHAWTNRARCDPQVEMQSCGSNCSEAACYTPVAPLPYSLTLNRAARFHSDNMAAQGFFAHDSQCALVSNIDALYPGSCQGAAECACTTGSPTAWYARVGLFGASASGEIIASSTDPQIAFYQWLYEPFGKTACQYDGGNPTNGHRWNILKSGPSIGYGLGSGAAVGDFGNGGTLSKIPSGSHYPRQAASIEAWANWYDTAGPKVALINVEGTCAPMSLQRGTVTNGAYRATLSGVETGCHRYFFLFKDSADNIVTYPTTGSLGIGPAGSCADWEATRPATGAGCDCTPQCTSKTCGDDGCGGSCGDCGDGESCEANVCVGSGGDGGDGGLAGFDDAAGGCGCAADAAGRGDAALALWLVALLGAGRRRRH